MYLVLLVRVLNLVRVVTMMVDAMKAVLDFFGTVLDFIEYLVTGLVQLFALIPSAFSMLTYSIGYLPTVLLAFAAVAITLSIVFLILGR